MWWKKPKQKEIDEILVRHIKYGLPGGVHVKDMLPLDRGPRGKMYFFGFVPDKFQPKPIHEILLEQIQEQKRNSRT